MSIQASMNQMIGQVGSLAYQLTAPQRFAKAQADEIAKREKEELNQAEQAIEATKKLYEDELNKPEDYDLPADKEAMTSEQAKNYSKQYEKFAETAEKQAELGKRYEQAMKEKVDLLYNKFKNEASQENYQGYIQAKKEYEDYIGGKGKATPSSEWLQYAQDARELSQRGKKELAEARALENILSKTNTQKEQKQALDWRIQAIRNLNKAGIISNTQMKKQIHQVQKGDK